MTRSNGITSVEAVQGLFKDKDAFKEMVSDIINEAMEAEVENHIHAGRYKRTEHRTGLRNGTKPRTFKTRIGELNLRVPQVRGGEPYHPTMFARWQRSERALLVACAEMYFQGVSTRNVRDILETMCGFEISPSVVSRMAMELDEKLAEFRDRRIDLVEYPYLIIDARYEKVRRSGRVVSTAALVSCGVTTTGQREVLDWRLGDSESEETWGEVFRTLKDRGLKGAALVVSDAHTGIRKAMSRHFQGVEWQRCRVHFKRELARKVSWRNYKELMADIATVFAPEERKECLTRGEEMAAKWEGRGFDKIAKMLREGLEDCLTVCGLPSEHRRRLNSTNMIERVMKEIKRRTRVIEVFPNEASCHRLVGALLVEMDEHWRAEENCYLNMELVGKDIAGMLAKDTVSVAA